MHAPAVVALCAALAEAGFAAAAVDLPLQGERASRKLSARLAACVARPERAGVDLLLWQEFLRQAEHDLAAAADALATRRELDLTRVACLGFEPGAEAAAALATRDTRVRAFRRVEEGEAPAPILRFLRERPCGAA